MPHMASRPETRANGFGKPPDACWQGRGHPPWQPHLGRSRSHLRALQSTIFRLSRGPHGSTTRAFKGARAFPCRTP